MKVLGQEFENVLEPQNDDDDADIFSKWYNVSFGQTLFFLFTIKTLDR